MHVQAAAGVFGKRFGHETGNEPVLLRDCLDGALEQHRVIAGKNRVVNVQEVDLELGRRKFGRGRVGRDALCLATVIQLVQEFLDVPEVIRVVDLGSRLRSP